MCSLMHRAPRVKLPMNNDVAGGSTNRARRLPSGNEHTDRLSPHRHFALGSRVTWYFPQTIVPILSTWRKLSAKRSPWSRPLHSSRWIIASAVRPAEVPPWPRNWGHPNTTPSIIPCSWAGQRRRPYGAGVGNRPFGLPRWG